MEAFLIIGFTNQLLTMELIRTLRKKYHNTRQNDVMKQAERYITLGDFADSLFIEYNGIPLIPIEASWTTKEIIEQLSMLRQNYVNAMMTD